MDDIQVIMDVVDNITLIGVLFLALRYVDTLRREARQYGDDRTDDIISDWKRMRGLDNN